MNNNSKNIIRKLISEVVSSVLFEDIAIRKKLQMKIPKNIWNIKNTLNKNGYKLFIIGGAVRDTLMGKTPHDYDLVTDATYNIIQNLFKNEPYVKNLLKIGEKFSISFLITTDGNYELATFRSDVGGGRKSTVEYVKTLEKDVQRRDFTINALAYDLDTMEVIDYVGGIADIEKKSVNAVGNAGDRMLDDPLRKLRAIRFAARTGSNLSKQTEEALLFSNSMIDINGGVVSMERRKEEFFKGIKSALSVVYFLQLLKKFHLLEKIFDDKRLLPIQEKDFAETKNPVVLVANLIKDSFRSIGRIGIEDALNKLKYSNKKGGKEIPRIILMNIILEIWLNKNFEQHRDDFLKAKSIFKLIKDIAINDVNEFAKINHINKKFINALFNYFNHVLSDEDKMSIAKEIGNGNGIKFGNAIKNKDFNYFLNN